MTTATATICPVLVPADRYWVEREGYSTDYTDYWGTIVDPDGVTRERLSEAERLKYLDAISEELEFVRQLAPRIVLDVGCGPGWFLDAIECESKVGTEICRSLVSPRFRLYRDLGYVLTAFEGACDVVRCHHVIEHVPDPMADILSMRALLADDGWLLLSTPDFGSPCAVRFGDRYRMLHDKTHRNLFTNESLHRFVRDVGFRVERVDYPCPWLHVQHVDGWNVAAGYVSPPWPGNWITLYCRKE